jgi:hypothetical protein
MRSRLSTHGFPQLNPSTHVCIHRAENLPLALTTQVEAQAQAIGTRFESFSSDAIAQLNFANFAQVRSRCINRSIALPEDDPVYELAC